MIKLARVLLTLARIARNLTCIYSGNGAIVCSHTRTIRGSIHTAIRCDAMEENITPRPSPRSLHSRIGTPVRFINRSRSRVKVLWLDYQGKQVLYSTLDPLNGRYDVNTYVTHPWIALEEPTNAVMLLNFKKVYFPVAPEVRRIESENRNVYVRSEVVITPNVPYTLQECCKDLLKKIVQPQNISQLPLPQSIIRQIIQTV